MYCISDNMEIAVGLRLTGIESIVLQEQNEIESEIEKVLDNKEIGILIVNDSIYNLCKNSLDKIKNNVKLPLLVKI